MSNHKVKWTERAAYGIGDLGNNISFGSIGFFYLYFLTTIAGLTPLWAGTILFIVQVSAAFFDFTAGAVSDRIPNKHGRRRPMILGGALFMAVSYAFLWVVPLGSLTEKVLYCILTGILYSACYSTVSIPYNALLPALSSDPRERTRVAGAKTSLSFVGTLIAAAGASYYLPMLMGHGQRPGYAMAYLTGAYSIIMIACLMICFFGTKEHVRPKTLPERIPVKELIAMLWSREEVWLVMFMFTCCMVATDCLMELYVFYLQYALHLSEETVGIFMVIPIVVAIVVSPFCSIITRKYGKLRTYLTSCFFYITLMFVTLFLPAHRPIATGFLAGFIGIGISLTQTLIFSILPDVIEVGDQEQGMQWEGTFYGVTFFNYRLTSAITILALSFAIGGSSLLTGDPTAGFSDLYFFTLGLRLLFTLPTIMYLGLSAYFAYRLLMEKSEDRFV